MKKIRNVFREIKGIKKLAQKLSCGKLDFCAIFIDILYCKLIFHVTRNEYLKYNFHNFKNRYRKNFLLIHHQKQFANITKRGVAKSKYCFYKTVPNLFSRGITLLPYCGEEEFLRFIKRYKKIMIKPDVGSLGRGIQVFKYTDEQSAREIFEKFSKSEPMICEEFIEQHHALMNFNPNSVNTVRIITILNNGNVEIVAAVFKTGGNKDAVVDNMHNGGIGAQIDIETGIVTTFGRDYDFNVYVYHPVSGEQFIGFNIPHWEKVRDFVKKAHLQIPESLIYGWDIAITETGIELIEINNSPGPMIMQTMDQIPKGEKIIKMIKTIKIQQEYRQGEYNPDYNAYFEHQEF